MGIGGHPWFHCQERQYHGSSTRGQCSSLWPACGLDGQSVITTDTAAATGLHCSWLMSGQSNLPVFELLYSSCFHTHACTHSHKTAHTDLQSTAEGIPFIKDHQAALCLFVCICDYGLAAPSLSSLMSHQQRQHQNTVFMYFFIWSYPIKTRIRSRYFWFRACRGNQALDV